ncbi:MAG: FAD-dependent oxidoreductase, partial [Saccharothrix sp.]|nr:FAD-dependent oxidoreductase [Saccharothrix sp.]
MTSVLVVGASAAGVATTEALRRKGFGGEVTLVGAEPHSPYDRPPLSKQVLAGTWEPDRTRLREVDARLVLGDPAVALDVAGRVVRTASGLEVGADAVVLATGVRPRKLPGQERLSGVHVLRTLDDSLALRADLLRAARVVVVGDGVLGAETAATARGLGLDVTLVGPLRAPLELQLGPHAAGVLGGLHLSRGVRLVRAAVSGLVGESRVSGVLLETGEELPADVVVVALGVAPNTEWLEGSGLVLDNGIVCDARCRAADGIYAVGDVARWQHERFGSIRLENRTNATEQAGAVADNILGEDRVYAPVPFFWTDQFDARIHLHGVSTDSVEVVEGDVEDRRFVAVHHR